MGYNEAWTSEENRYMRSWMRQTYFTAGKEASIGKLTTKDCLSI